MNDNDVREMVLRLTGPQLAKLIVLAGIDAGSVEGTAPASRAASVLALAEGVGGPGLTSIRTALKKMFPGLDIDAPAVPQEKADQQQRRVTVLMLASSPINVGQITWAKELSSIERVAGQVLNIRPEPALRVEDLTSTIATINPDVIHFAGHGTSDGSIVLEDAHGAAKLLPVAALAAILGERPRKLRCIVLNACYSAEMATALQNAADYVVGMHRDIGNEDAVAFASGFYNSLVQHGDDIRRAFRLGCEEISLRSLPDALVPHLVASGVEEAALPAVPERQERDARHVWVFNERRLRQDEIDRATACEVWFATNRKPVTGSGATAFGGERDDVVHEGKCVVDIPRSHRIGEDSPSWWRKLFGGDITPEARLRQTTLLSAEAFDGSLAEQFKVEASALVFIHGFNVSFESAAIRTAQLKADLKIPIAAFFSWPSFARVDYYGYDGQSIEFSKEALLSFLQRIRQLSGGKPVHVLAHSMGNRGLLWCLRELVSRGAASSLFGQVMLAAPDVDRDNFNKDAAGTPVVGRRMTVYVSERDRALKISREVHKSPRAGLHPPVTTLSGADTISVTHVDLSFLGHGFYAAARPVLEDMHDLMTSNTAPADRFALQPEKTPEGQQFWRIQA